jgi:type VI secretion system protein ImpL
MTSSFVAFVRSRWCYSLAGTALLALLAWWFSPLVPSFEDLGIRVALILLMLLVWSVVNLLIALRLRARDTRLAAGLTTDAAEEAEAVRLKLSAALALLKRSRGSRGYLYEQPWYAIIGPPGAGKTTALLNAGLNFPLAAQMGEGALSGVGGTRLCEWWFTDAAVLIDTAGRYTTQDSDAALDRAGWEAFLKLLRRTRPRQPLNGAMVAISLGDMAQASRVERAAHANAIRQRVEELERFLGVRLPVYALFTKADLIAGFTEFFDDLDGEQRAQVWGQTFSLPTGAATPVDQFAAEFRALIERLHLRLFERLRAEPDQERRSLIAMFPGQVASLERPLAEFLKAAFGSQAAGEAPLLRGSYLTSATQEGTPIDRLIGVLSRSLGPNRGRPSPRPPGEGRSYFLNRLLRDVIFNEAMLVSRGPKAARRGRLPRMVQFAIAVFMVGAAGALLERILTTGQRQVDAVDMALRAYEAAALPLPLDPVADADLPQLAPLLDRGRALSLGSRDASARVPPWCCLGLSQGAKLAMAARSVYRHALERALLPRMVSRLEAQLRGNMNQPDFLYEATRVYLMLGGAGPLDRGLVREWMKLDWETAWPGAEFAPVRDSLLGHLDALLDDELPQVALDGELVAQGRRTFGGVTLAQRAYSRVRPSQAAQRLAPWRPSDVLGPVGAELFVRSSGKALSDGVPGFFTIDGFHNVLLPGLGRASDSVVSESWVLGQKIDVDANSPEMRSLRDEIVLLYEADYARAWDGMLADLNLRPMHSLPRAAQDLYVLASPRSPMRELLVSMARQLRLSVSPVTKQAETKAVEPALQADVGSDLERIRVALKKVQPAATSPVPPGREIDDRYRSLLSLAGDGPGAPIDLVLRSIGDVQQQIAKQAAAPIGTTVPAPPGGDPALALQTEAGRQPEPLARWLAAISGSAIALRDGDLKSQVTGVFNGPGGLAGVCPASVDKHYPFARDSAKDISLAEFSRLFAPGGLFDAFVNTMLRPYVDMSGSVWHPRMADGISAPVVQAELAQFQRAARIRETFFAAGVTAPSIHLDITPVSLDATTKQVTLELGGTAIVASHGAAHSTQVTWPGATPPQVARLVFDPPPLDQAGFPQESGPWSMFRLFGRGRWQPGTTRDRDTLTFRLGDREVAFEIHTGSTVNPFMSGVTQEFRCPVVGGM